MVSTLPEQIPTSKALITLRCCTKLALFRLPFNLAAILAVFPQAPQKGHGKVSRKRAL